MPSECPPEGFIFRKVSMLEFSFIQAILLNKADAYALFWCFQVPPSSAILLYLPHNFYNSKSVGSDTVRVRPPPPAPKKHRPFSGRYFFMFRRGRTKPDDGVNKTVL